MLWFNGPIRAAVDKVKSTGVVLVVFVQGNDELSGKYETFLNNETKFQPQDYVALKISNASVAFKQFKQIYISVPIPSVFVIKNNGIPANVVTSKNISDIAKAVDEAVKTCKSDVNMLKNELKNGGNKENSILNCNESEKSATGVSVKTSYATNTGHKVFDISEEELKKRLNEIRAFPRFLLINDSCSKPVPLVNPVSKIQSARIQFRLPNNEVPSWEFPDLSTLHDVRAYLMEKMKLSPNFKLLRSYPRTGFTQEDEQKTLIELSLTPNATLIVVPVQDKTVQAKVKSIIVQQNIILVMAQTLMQPFLILLKYFKKHVLRIEDDRQTMPIGAPSETDVNTDINKKTSTGNIHGFSFQEDSDTEGEHPDNGNSTQQRYQK